MTSWSIRGEVLQTRSRARGIVGYVHARQGNRGAFAGRAPNVQNLMYDSERKIEVDWGGANARRFVPRPPSWFHTDDRPGLLHQLTSVLSDENTKRAQPRSEDGCGEATTDVALVEMTVDVRDKETTGKALLRVPSHLRCKRCGTSRQSMTNQSMTPQLNDPEHIAILEIEKELKSTGRTGITARFRRGVSARLVSLRKLWRARHGTEPRPKTTSMPRGAPANTVFRCISPKRKWSRSNPWATYAFAYRLERRGTNTGIYSYEPSAHYLPLSGMPGEGERFGLTNHVEKNSGCRG